MEARSIYNWVKNSLLGAQPCLLCDADATPALSVCDDCLDELPYNDLACERCARPLAAAAHLCGACIRRPPLLAATRCALRYAPPADTLIHALKYRGCLAAVPVLAELLRRRVVDAPRPDCLVPIPLHVGRLRERGFNQSAELARELGRRLDIPVASRLLVRRRATAPQTELPAAQRRRNLIGAFDSRTVSPFRRIALVDDVMTTGATGEAAAAALLHAGATEVVLWCAARTPES